MKNELLAKYILGEADTEECQIVKHWLEESDDHQQEFQRIERRVRLGAKRYQYGLFDTRQAAQKINFPAKRHSWRIWYVAATIIILISGIWYWSRPQSKETILISKAGERKVFYLPDSSRVTLTGDSRLTYNSEYGKANRELFLQGKAFFKVKRDTGKPFVVQTSLIQVEVLGTSFQVISRKFLAEVSVREGCVKVATRDKKQEKILETGMSVKYEKGDDELVIFTEFDEDQFVREAGIFKFDNALLSEVIKVLNEHYGCHIVLPDDYASLRISVVFKGVSLKEAIEVINRTLDIQLTI